MGFNYLQYKRDTSQLLQWICSTANRLPKNDSEPIAKDASPTKITVGRVLSFSRAISERVKPAPSTILTLFESVIAARTEAHMFYKQMTSYDSNPDIKANNVSHLYFLDILKQSFEALGGNEWKAQQKTATSSAKAENDEEDEETLFMNKFEGLEIGDAEVDDEGDEEDNEGEKKENKAPSSAKKGKKVKAKGKKGKKIKGKVFFKTTPQEFPEYSIEDYRFAEDDGFSDLSVAIYCFMMQILELRIYTQELWRQVAHDIISCVTAAAMCNLAIAKVKQLQYEIAADFPAHSSFDAIVNVVTKGKEDSGMNINSASHQLVDGRVERAAETTHVDCKEMLLINAYRDLKAFVEDYRKNRNGKPSKSMAANLKWNPNLKPMNVSEKERMDWRSTYAICWLYDAVNTHAGPALQKQLGAEKYEMLDYGPTGQYTRRMLFGPMEFIGEMTAMCLKVKSVGALEKAILPHHVFTVQLVLDSMTALKGWTFNPIVGSTLVPPPITNWKEHPGMKEIKIWKEDEETGFQPGAERYMMMLQEDIIRNGDPSRHQYPINDLPETVSEVALGLGQTILSANPEVPRIPQSTFGPSSNGLWEYSPFMCGTGLVECLAIFHDYGMLAFDNGTAPASLIHLYHLLRQTGHIKTPITMFETLFKLYGKYVFLGGIPPTHDFFRSWMRDIGVKPEALIDPRRKRQNRGGNLLQAGDKNIIRRGPDKRWFKGESLIGLLNLNNWMPEKIQDKDIPVDSYMAYRRVQQLRAPQPRIPKLPKRGFKKALVKTVNVIPSVDDNPLVRRMKEAGTFDDEFFGKIAMKIAETKLVNSVSAEIRKAMLEANGINDQGTHIKDTFTAKRSGFDYEIPMLFHDISNDIEAEAHPPSGMNYFFILSFLMAAARTLDDALDALPAARAFKRKHYGYTGRPTDSASTVVSMAMHFYKDEGPDNIVAQFLGQRMPEIFKNLPLNHWIYWEHTNASEESFMDDIKTGNYKPPPEGQQCAMM